LPLEGFAVLRRDGVSGPVLNVEWSSETHAFFFDLNFTGGSISAFSCVLMGFNAIDVKSNLLKQTGGKFGLTFFI